MNTSQPHLAKLAQEAIHRFIPLDVCLELTHRCNFRCIHCYIPDHTLGDAVPTNRIFELLDELADMGTLFLALSGGEVMTHPDWLAVARRARERTFVVRLLTNGSLITPDIAAELAGLHARVDISLYAAEAKLFDSITGAPGSFDRVVRGIELLQRAGVPVLLKTPLMAANADLVPAIAAFAERLGLEWRAFPSLIHRKDGDPGPTHHQAGEQQLCNLYCGPHSPLSASLDTATAPTGDYTICAAGIRSAVIAPNGDVHACISLPGVAGSILQDSFRHIWENSPWLYHLRSLRVVDLKGCADCHRLAYCGRCPAQALAETGDLLGVSPSACALAEVIERTHGRDR